MSDRFCYGCKIKGVSTPLDLAWPSEFCTSCRPTKSKPHPMTTKQVSTVIVNGDEASLKEIFKMMAKLGYRAPENYDPMPDGTKIVVFTKDCRPPVHHPNPCGEIPLT